MGVTVASVAIVLLISIALGVREDITQEVRGLGVNLIVVLPGRIEPSDLMFNPNLAGISFLNEKEAERVRTVPGVVRATPLTFAGGGIRRDKKEAFPITIATTPDWFQIRPVQMQAGRTFDWNEEQSDVCVVGSIAKESLFGKENAIGQKVFYNKRPYTIVGVTQDKKSSQSLLSMGGFENVVYFPYHALKREIPNLQTHRIMIQTAPDVEPKALVKRIDDLLGQDLDRQQYSVLTQEDLLGLVYKVMSILTWLLSGLTSIALFVGGVGIMAVMTMSVNERAREIGIRKAVGARRSDIFLQFVTEAATMGAFGGLAGLILSWIVCQAFIHYTKIHPVITPGVVALSFGICIGVGTLFGVLPALNAARRDPVVALRAE
ncbi:MAG: putative transport system permease protein [Fimbriimonadaceae bacterium]|nr:putative transport system permease protein [Fimbriimonadaceae bacterium]